MRAAVGSQGQGGQGVELEPRREAGHSAAQARRDDPGGTEEDGGQDRRGEDVVVGWSGGGPN